MWQGGAPSGVALPASPSPWGPQCPWAVAPPLWSASDPSPASFPVSGALSLLSRAGLLPAFGPTLVQYDLISTELIKSAQSLILNKVTSDLSKHAFFWGGGDIIWPREISWKRGQ